MAALQVSGLNTEPLLEQAAPPGENIRLHLLCRKSEFQYLQFCCCITKTLLGHRVPNEPQRKHTVSSTDVIMRD